MKKRMDLSKDLDTEAFSPHSEYYYVRWMIRSLLELECPDRRSRRVGDKHQDRWFLSYGELRSHLLSHQEIVMHESNWNSKYDRKYATSYVIALLDRLFVFFHHGRGRARLPVKAGGTWTAWGRLSDNREKDVEYLIKTLDVPLQIITKEVLSRNKQSTPLWKSGLTASADTLASRRHTSA